MKRILVSILSSILILSNSFAVSFADIQPDRTEYQTKAEYLQSAQSSEQQGTEAQGFLVKLEQEISEKVLLSVDCEAIGEQLYYADTLQKVQQLSMMGMVQYCEPNEVLLTQDFDEDYLPEAWNLQSIEAAAGWAHRNAAGRRDRLGSSVTVAIVDSGVMADHPDLQNVEILETVVCSGEEDGLDDYHGTFIAGLLSAEVNNGIGIDGMVPEREHSI